METYDFTRTVNPESRRRFTDIDTDDGRIAASKKKLSQSKRVAEQAMYYVGAFLVAWLFPTIFQLWIVIAGTHPFPLLFLTALFVPIQGVLNLIVFIRPKFTTYRRRNPDGNAIVAWFRMLYSEITTDTTSNTTPLGLVERPDRLSIFSFRFITSLKSTWRKMALTSAENGEVRSLQEGDEQEEYQRRDTPVTPFDASIYDPKNTPGNTEQNPIN